MGGYAIPVVKENAFLRSFRELSNQLGVFQIWGKIRYIDIWLGLWVMIVINFVVCGEA